MHIDQQPVEDLEDSSIPPTHSTCSVDLETRESDRESVQDLQDMETDTLDHDAEYDVEEEEVFDRDEETDSETEECGEERYTRLYLNK